MQLADALRALVEIPDAESYRHRIEASVGEGQFRGIPVTEIYLRRLLSGQGQHVLRYIGTYYFESLSLQGYRDVTCPAGHIQDFDFSASESTERGYRTHQTSPPGTVYSEGEKMIQSVVHRGNGIEHRGDRLPALVKLSFRHIPR